MRNSILQFYVITRWRSPWLVRSILMLTLLVPLTVIAQAQTTVRGKIVDESGVGMPGVNVLVKGTTTGTTSNENGNYSIQVPGNNAVLVFSFIGYTTKEVAVDNKSVLNVSLAQSTEALSQVVVIGYGSQRREAVTGSVASVSGAKLN